MRADTSTPRTGIHPAVRSLSRLRHLRGEIQSVQGEECSPSFPADSHSSCGKFKGAAVVIHPAVALRRACLPRRALRGELHAPIAAGVARLGLIHDVQVEPGVTVAEQDDEALDFLTVFYGSVDCMSSAGRRPTLSPVRRTAYIRSLYADGHGQITAGAPKAVSFAQGAGSFFAMALLDAMQGTRHSRW
jgi:hypothetical protein